MNRLTILESVTLDAEPARVFQALVTPAEIVHYFPFRKVESDGRVGGAIRFHGELGGRPFIDDGRITAWEPSREFAYTYWGDNHGTPRTPENHLEIRYALESTDDRRTLLTVAHRNLPAGPYHEAMRSAWGGLLQRLAAYLDQERGGAHSAP